MHRQPILPLILLTALFAGCGADQADGPDASGSASTTLPPEGGGLAAGTDIDLEGKEHFVVDPAASEVYWTISPAGPAARFGRRHASRA